MIVFDASGSMAGNVNQGIATIIPRIDEGREALSPGLAERYAISSRGSHHFRSRAL